MWGSFDDQRIEDFARRAREAAGGDPQRGYMLVDMARNDPQQRKTLFPDINDDELKLVSNYMYPQAQLPGMSIPSAIGGAAYEAVGKPIIQALGDYAPLPEGIKNKPGVSVPFDLSKVPQRANAYAKGAMRSLYDFFD